MVSEQTAAACGRNNKWSFENCVTFRLLQLLLLRLVNARLHTSNDRYGHPAPKDVPREKGNHLNLWRGRTKGFGYKILINIWGHDLSNLKLNTSGINYQQNRGRISWVEVWGEGLSKVKVVGHFRDSNVFYDLSPFAPFSCPQMGLPADDYNSGQEEGQPANWPAGYWAIKGVLP